MLGSSYFVSIANTTITQGTNGFPATPPIVPRGTWLIQYVFKCPSNNAVISNILTQIVCGSSNISTGTYQSSATQNTTDGIGTTGSGVVRVTDDVTTISILVIVNYVSGGPLVTNANSNIQLTRIG